MLLRDFISKGKTSSSVRKFVEEVAGLSPDADVRDFVQMIVLETPRAFLDRARLTMIETWRADGSFSTAVAHLYSSLKNLHSKDYVDVDGFVAMINGICTLNKKLQTAYKAKKRLEEKLNLELEPKFMADRTISLHCKGF